MSDTIQTEGPLLTWEQILYAFMKLHPFCTVRMREPGNWYVDAQMEHAHGATMLLGDCGNGRTPEAAVADHARKYMDGRPLHYRDEWFRWNGFMWEASERP